MTAATSTRPRADDDGFTLVEVVVAVGLIAIVMTSVTAFLVTALAVTSQQSGRKGAVQVADDAAELVRALKGSALTVGRDFTSVDTQWATGRQNSMVAPYLDVTAMAMAYESPTTAPSPVLPTTAELVTTNGVTYQRYWYVGRCYQPAAGGDCTATVNDVPFYRVVVVVTWTDRKCPTPACTYVTVTLVSSAPGDPVFNSNQTAVAPTVNNPGNRTGEVAAAASLQVTASGGAAPLTWTATGLPAGLSISSGGLITGTPTTAATYSVVVKVTDGFGLFGDAAFTWTITPAPTVTTPGSQAGEVGIAVTPLQIVASGGTTPYTWSAVNLPSGLTIGSTGRITGTPTTVGSYANARVTVTDAIGASVSTSPFTWTVAAALAIASPTTAQNGTDGTAVVVQATATGGIAPYTWSGANLPSGLSINSSGRISGTPTVGTRWLATITVTDAAGATDSVTLPWGVASAAYSIISPTGDRTDVLGTHVVFSANSSGSTSGNSWSATGMPPGMSMSTGGTITGYPSARGTYVTTIRATRSGESATFMFRWTIT